MTLWYKIEQFLKISDVKKEEVQAFPLRIDQFESNIKLFYKCGVLTFPTKEEPSNDEIYYIYVYGYGATFQLFVDKHRLITGVGWKS